MDLFNGISSKTIAEKCSADLSGAPEPSPAQTFLLNLHPFTREMLSFLTPWNVTRELEASDQSPFLGFPLLVFLDVFCRM